MCCHEVEEVVRHADSLHRTVTGLMFRRVRQALLDVATLDCAHETICPDDRSSTQDSSRGKHDLQHMPYCPVVRRLRMRLAPRLAHDCP